MVVVLSRRAAMLVLALFVGTFGLAADARAQAARIPGAYPPVTLSSGIQIQNLSTQAAHVTVSYIGTFPATQSLTIPASQSVTLFGDSMEVSTEFFGSAVITSDQPVAAITNVQTTNPPTGEAYNGIGQPATTVHVPLFQQANGGFDTSLFVMNASSLSNDVTVTFLSATGAVVSTASASVPPLGSTAFPATPLPITGAFVGSAIVTAAQPVAVVVKQSNGAILFLSNGSAAGSPTLFAPLLMTDNNGWSTGLQVQNRGTLATTASLFLNGGTTAVAAARLNPGQSVTWFPLPGTTAGTRFVGSGTVTSDNGQPLVGIVNELNTVTGQGMAYDTFNGGSQTVNLPLIMFDNHGFFTGEQIQNVGTCDTTVDFSIDGTLVTSRALAIGQSFTLFSTTSNPIPNGGTVAGATARARDACGAIVGIVNEGTSPQQGGDTSFAYGGIASGFLQMFLPAVYKDFAH